MTKDHNGSAPKITQDKLEEELKNGKTQKQIAHEYGYGHPSRVLADKIRELGYDVRQRLNQNGNDYYIPPSTVEKAIEKAGLDPEQTIYFESGITDNGVIQVRPTKQKWRKEEKTED